MKLNKLLTILFPVIMYSKNKLSDKEEQMIEELHQEYTIDGATMLVLEYQLKSNGRDLLTDVLIQSFFIVLFIVFVGCIIALVL